MRPYALFPYHQHGNFATLLLAGVQIVDYVLDLPHLAVTFVQLQFCRLHSVVATHLLLHHPIPVGKQSRT